MGLRLRPVKFPQGQVWLRAGLRTYIQHPFAFITLFTGYLLLTALLGAIPLVGPVLAVGTLPLLSLVFMIATQQVLQGQPARLGLLFAWWRGPVPQRRALLLLCGAYGILVASLVALAFWEGGDELQAALKPLTSQQSGPADLMAVFTSAAVSRLVNWITLGVALISVPYWHALALVRWGGQSAGQALFSSTLALWRTRGAMAVYGLSWLGCTLLGSLLASLCSALLAAVGGGALALLPGVVIMLSLSAAFYASLWFMFADSFELAEAPAG